MKFSFSKVSPASVLLLGIFLRVLIAPFTLNWDLLANSRLITEWGILPIAEFYKQPLAAYPPLLYGLLKIVLQISQFISGNQLFSWLSLHDVALLHHPHVFRLLLLLKTPYLLAEILTAIVLTKLFEPKYETRVLLLWMLSPFIFFTIAIWSNIDIFPLCALIVSLFFVKKKLPFAASVSLGISVALKMFPVFIFPFLFFYQKHKFQKLQVLIGFVLPILITHLPVLTLGQYWSHTITSGYSKQILYTVLPIGPDRALIYYYLVYFLLLFHFIRKSITDFSDYLFYALATFVPLFILSRFNLQWILWIAPLFIVYQILVPKPNTFWLFLTLAFFALVGASQSSLNIGMLAPIESTFWVWDWPLKQKLGGELTTMLLNNAHTLFSGVLIWITYLVYKYALKSHATT